MKIANKLITSIACYRKHFDFHAVWNQLDIFLRDMSPKDVPYPDKSSEILYYIINAPSDICKKELFKVVDNKIIVDDTDGENVFTINNAESLRLDVFQKESFEERIRIIALFELAGKQISNDSFDDGLLYLVKTSVNELSDGQTLKIVQTDYNGLKLSLNKIYVNTNSASSSIVDGIEIRPGKFAYGVYSEHGLHKVLKTKVQNDSYSMILSTDSTEDCLIIKDELYGTKRTIHNVKSFCTIGHDNYAYISNGQVYCHHDESLSKRLKNTIGVLDLPLFICSDNEKITITMEDGTVKSITL